MHYVEVHPIEESSDEECMDNDGYDSDEPSYRTMSTQRPSPKPSTSTTPSGGILAILSGTNEYFTIKVPGEVLGESLF